MSDMKAPKQKLGIERRILVAVGNNRREGDRY